ncbi:Serum paraoxonase/arylesterase 1 [Mortierella sp. GBA30]|nr:Serum paraoxonase/arylesterase 1 [Mortierella sp. GBA30]
MANKKKTTKAAHASPAATSSQSSGAIKSLVRGSAAILALTAALGYTFVRDFVIDSGILLGDIQPINVEGCEPVKGLQACEDIHIHHASGLAFTTCGHVESRKDWYPPVAKTNASAGINAFQDKFVIYDIPSGAYEVKELVGLPADTDRVFHGIGVYERSPTELTFFAINHRRTGSVVEVLEYTIGGDTVKYIETIKHDLIRTPNDIVATGPRSFYVTNDHRYPIGLMRQVEEMLRRPWGNIVYYSPEQTFVAFDGVVSANGITSSLDGSRVFVSACHGGAVQVLEPREDHTLKELDLIKLDFFNDNPSLDPETGDIFVAGHVQPLKFVGDLKVPGKVIVGPSKIVKISKNPSVDTSSSGISQYMVDTVLLDDGNLISTGTTAAIDRKRGVMLVGTAFGTKGLIRCPVPKNA